MEHDDAIRQRAEALTVIVRDAVKDALSEICFSTGDTTTMVSVAEAARRLSIGRTKLNELISSRALPSVTVGERRLLRRSTSTPSPPVKATVRELRVRASEVQ